MPLRVALVFVSIGFVYVHSPALAGEIALKNGDLLKGELLEIQQQVVIWQSQNFGDLSIPKSNIIRIETNAALKLQGLAQPCYWRGLMAADAFFQCAKKRRSVPFLAIQQISRYEEHREISRSFVGKVTASGSQASGNREEQSWLVDVDSNYRYTDFRHDVRYLYSLKSVAESPEQAFYQARYAFNWFFNPQTYWIWSVSQERDDAKNLEFRRSTGTGIGYQFWESERRVLSLELGAEDVTEETSLFDLETGVEQRTLNNFGSVRVSTNFTYQLLENVTFYNRNVFNQSVDVRREWKILTDSGISLPFGLGISADIKLQYEFQNMPPGENRKEDTTLRLGLGYSW